MGQLFSNSTVLDGIYFKHARGISERSGKEFHIQHEIIYFLDGDAEFVSESMRMRLKPKTFILIPKETFHQLIVHGDQNHYYRCILRFSDLPELNNVSYAHINKIKAAAADEEITYLFRKLIHLNSQSSADSAPLLRSILILLLNCISTKAEAADKEDLQSDIIRTAIHYINQNIGKKILISHIAAICNISPSSLSHNFKKEMNISLHQFVLRKRLIAAYHKIASGEPATSAAIECGFHDYSGFYKQYKKMFGFSPSKNEAQSDTISKTTD